MRRTNVFWGIFFLFVILLLPKQINAADISGQETTSEEMEGYVWELKDTIDFSDIDDFLEGTTAGEEITFSELLGQLLEQGIMDFDYGQLLEWGKDLLFYEIESNRNLLLEVLFLIFFFSILSNFAGVFDKAYIAEICFVLLYCVLAVLLLKSLTFVSEIVTDSLGSCIGFMKAMVPTFCFTMVFSANISTSIGFYQLSFLIIYLIEWVFETFLIPMIHIYIVMEVLSNFFEEEKFKGITELLKSFIGWSFKISWAMILGLNVVQNLIAPAKDRLTSGTFGRVASAIPGIGNSMNSIGELLLGSGLVIKNGVGVAAILVLGFLCLVPMLKILCMVVLYKIVGAVAQPISDKRIFGCMEGIASGSMLYAKTLGTCLLLFVLTIALTTAATSFIY